MQLLNPLTVYRADLRYLRHKAEVGCLASDSVGNFVHIRAGIATGRWSVEQADPGDEAKMPAVGVLISKDTATTGVVQVWGPLQGLFTGLTPGQVYCLDYDGIKIGPPPTGGGGYAMRQFVGVALNPDVLFLDLNLSMTKRRS